MLRSFARRWTGAMFAFLVGGFAASATAQTPTPVPTPSPTPVAAEPTAADQGTTQPSFEQDVIVSATKVDQENIDVPNSVSVISGEELRRRGTQTVADALQNVVGVDTGDGSDNGPRLPNIGVYGVKEFDALMVTVDGVPVGGPFNPNLAMIPVDDIDRIEIVRGPQGSLYGTSAFAGMVQVFTRNHPSGSAWGSATAGGFGAFHQGWGTVNLGQQINPDFALRINGFIAQGGGWQQRTDFTREQLRISLDNQFGQTKMTTSILWFRDTNFWGSPQPVDAGQPVPGFEDPDENFAVQGARVDHHVIGLFNNIQTPITSNMYFENILGVTNDNQGSIRSFVTAVDGDEAESEGIALYPKEYVVYDDAHIVTTFEAAGQHRLVGGAALTWGQTTAEGHGFDFDFEIDPEDIPVYGTFPFGDNRNFKDTRTFVGIYVNDQWTPVPWFTLTVGGREDFTKESLDVFQQEIGDDEAEEVHDESNVNRFSWGVSGMFHIVDRQQGGLTGMSLYGAARRNFKPAAPNLSEAENAEILDPETTNMQEAGLKTLWLDGNLSLNVTWYHMIFSNLVVGVLTPDGPALTNAGKVRFQGTEVEIGYALPFVEYLSLYGGYAHHDNIFKQFTFITPDGEFRNVAGKRLELDPRDMWNFKFVLAPPQGFGGFAALRHQNHRPLNRRNTFYTPSFYQFDAGLSFVWNCFQLSVIGRNLTDARPYTTESEIGDSQFYVAPPRGVSAQLTVSF